MRRTSKTLLYFFAVACLAAILSVSLWAAEYDYAHVKTFQDKSVYADITYANGWVQVATSGTKQDADGDGLYVKEGDLPYGSSYRAYFNENTKTLVIEGGGAYSSPSANYGDYQNTDGKRNHMFPYWCSLNADKVEHLEFRNIGSLNNGGYIVRPLKSVKTVKMDTLASNYRATKEDTAPFAGLTSLTTLGWGSWDKATGAWTPSSEYYNEGVVDLRGFIYLQPSGTTSKVPDQILYANSALRSSTSVKEVILPETLTLQNTALEYNISEISDGTSNFPKYDGTGNIPSGTVAYRMVNSETGAIAYGTSWQAPSGWAFVKAKAAEIEPYLGQFAGMIPYDFARGAKGLEKVTIPESVNLYRIFSYAFYGCSSLKEIYITGTVDESFVIDANAFGSGSNTVKGVAIYVTSVDDVVRVNAALDAAGYTDRSVIYAVCPLKSPITADGFQVKINTKYNGLRGLFTFNETSKAVYSEMGYDFAEYGVAVCTKTVAEALGSNDAILNSSDPRIRRIAVEKADGTGANRYVDYEKRQFCIALTNIPQDRSMDDVYFVAYSVWKDAYGEDQYVYTTYTASDDENYVNLYEVTLGLFKNGLINTETVKNAGGNADAIIWEPLKVGAVTIAAADFATPGTPKNSSSGTTYALNISAAYNDDGSFTYLDLPLHRLTGAAAANYSYNPSNFEAAATTNVVWSLYVYGDEYVAVYRRDPAAAEDAKAVLPTQTISSNGGIHPFRDNYGALKTNKVSGDVTIYSPVLTTTNARKVKTLVIDYGVNGTENRTGGNGSFALGNAAYTTTIVYPNGFAPAASSQSLLRQNGSLENVIWANKPAQTEAQKYHMGDVTMSVPGETLGSLYDLRGMGKIHPEAFVLDSKLVKNIVFAGFAAGSATQSFGGINEIDRVWIDDGGVTTAPASKTIDLSLDTTLKTIGRQCFNLKSEGYTVKLSDNVSAISSFTGSYGSAFAVTFGAKLLPVTVEAANPAFEAAFYNLYASLAPTAYRIYAQNVTVNGKTYMDIREDVCFVDESKLVIYEPLHSDINRNYDYKVSVHQGTQSATLPVYNHTMFNTPGDRSVGGDVYRRYSAFAFCGDQVRVDIKVGRDFSTYSVIPSAKNFESTFDASTGTISVYLDEPDYFGIRLDDMDNSIISIFADRPEYPDEEGITADSGDTIYVGPGDWYFPQTGDGKTETTDGHKGTLYITKPNTTVYVAPGGVLYGRVKFISTATNSSVIGHGAIVDPFADSRVLDIRRGGTEGGGNYTAEYKSQFMEIRCSNFLYDGPVLMDARCFHITVSSCSNVVVRNYKAMSSMMTTDGITDTSKAGRFEHCWLYVGDNALVVSGSNGAYYNDITIGTTCAAIFPQSNTRNTLLENIYVFRANDGIINHRYNPSGNDLVATMTFRNFDCIDTINYPQFFYGYNMGVSADKVFTFENLSLPWGSGMTDPHKTKIESYTGLRNVLVEITQPTSSAPSGNYTMNFVNTYVDGTLIDSQDKAVLDVTLAEGTTIDYSFSSNGKYTPAQRNVHTVNYTATGKVYIGSLLVGFENDVIIEGSTFYLPAEEILAKLRTSATPTTVTKNGIAYVAHTALKTSGAAKAVSVSGGNLTITPVAPSSTENIVIDNSGLITREYETTCYHIDLVQNTGDGVMYAYPHGTNQYNGGIGYHITEEIKMYGAGTYKFSLKAKCQPLEGGAYTPVYLIFCHDTEDAYTRTYDTRYTLTGDWTEYTKTFTVTEDMVKNGIGFSIYITGYNNVPVEYYAVKDMVVTKVS